MVDLDDREQIQKLDQGKMGQLLEEFPLQCEQALALGQGMEIPFSRDAIKNILITGLGGSAIGGDLIKALLIHQLPLPLYINRGYQLPIFIDRDSLVIAVSYSGNTEETISAFQEALQARCHILVITCNGTLGQLARDHGLPWLKIPAGYPPRAALGFLFFTIWKILQRLGLSPEQGQAEEETIGLLKALSRKYSLRQPFPENEAKQLAQRLQQKIPIIYGSLDNTEVVAYRWKCQFNENSKVFATYHIFPELNHNEIMGWEVAGPMANQAVVIILRDQDDHRRIKQRIELTAEMLRERVDLILIDSQGDSRLARLFSLIYLGDYVSYYLALLRNLDPTPVRSINQLKQSLIR